MTPPLRQSRGKSNLLAPAPPKSFGPIALALAALTVALFSPAFFNDFINFDDERFIYQNRQVLQGLNLETVVWALRTTENANWYPLSRLSHLVDVSLFGTWAGGHHLVSAAWHAGAAALLFLALRLMTGALGRSFAVAALFAAHPLQVESVAWAAERSNVLAGFFFALTLLLWAHHVRRPRPALLAAALLSFAFGLMAKPVPVSLPLVLLILDAWPLGRLHAPAAPRAGSARALPAGMSLIVEKIPFLALSVASGVVTLLTQKQVGAVQSLDSYPPAVRVGNAALSLGRYLGKILWPADLAPYYPHEGADLSLGAAVASGALLVALSAWAWLHIRRRPWLAAGWLWFLATMAPTIGIVQVSSQAMADRYAYLPIIGVLLALVWTGGALAPPKALAAAAALALLALSATTVAYASRWRDSVTLYTHALGVTRGNWVIETDLALALAAAGRFEEAIGHYRKALAIRPSDARLHNNLGVALRSLGRFDEAAEHFRQALRLKPDYDKALQNLVKTHDAARVGGAVNR